MPTKKINSNLKKQKSRSRKCPDPIVEKNRELLLRRSEFGISKYGTTIKDNPLSLKQWLEHALLECLDQANYLQAAITRIEAEGKAIENMFII